ncbi:MAG: ATP-binding protein, partial [Rhodothermales bacterium]
KSPLVTIKGFTSMLREDVALGEAERVEADLTHIETAAEQMYHLLADLLELSRQGRVINVSEEVSLSVLVEEAAGLLAGLTVARGVEVEIAPDQPMVWGDRVRLREVYQNLIENAVKYMGNQAAPRIEVGARKNGVDEVLCWVRDNGIGIDPAFHEQVFRLFDQLDPAMEGTGTGLALVKRIVEVHGGRIWIESEGVGHGATFCFNLPV